MYIYIYIIYNKYNGRNLIAINRCLTGGKATLNGSLQRATISADLIPPREEALQEAAGLLHQGGACGLKDRASGAQWPSERLSKGVQRSAAGRIRYKPSSTTLRLRALFVFSASGIRKAMSTALMLSVLPSFMACSTMRSQATCGDWLRRR